jgi:sugar lactone lactonase YvrE
MDALLVSQLEKVASGVTRPEDVLRLPDGRVFTSDEGAAVAEILPNGGRVPVGKSGGAPNGIGVLGQDRLAIANFDLGCLQELDLRTGTVTTIADRTDEGQRLRYANYPLVDRAGGVWLSCCTTREDITLALADPQPDGLIVYVSPDGRVRVVARETFPNCLAFDPQGRYLYVARTATTDVVRYPVPAFGQLGPPERYGPLLGGRRPDEVGEHYRRAVEDPGLVARWGFADGCAFDALGNLWVTLAMANAIVAITPAGSAVPVTLSGEVVAPTSVCWSGEDMRDVYIGSLTASYVLKGRSSVPGTERYPANHA